MTLNTNTTKDTKLEDRFRLLYKITSQTALGTTEQLENALELACELLGLEVGIISRIEDSTYVIKHFYPEESGLEKGQAFPLGDTYCSITLEADEAVSIPHMEKSPHKRHPCYNVFMLESYIGVPIEIDDKLYGTLNFSSTEPYETGFSETDKDFIRLLGEWVANSIKQQNITEQLRNRNEALEKINYTTSKIYSVIGHDLKSPINAITGFAEILLNDFKGEENDAKAVKKLEIISQSGHRISRLLNDLLSWARIQTGDLNFLIEERSLTDIVEETIDLLSVSAQKKGVELTFIHNGDVQVKGDKRMLTTIIRNLLSNAIKYSCEGDRVEIKLETGGEYWSLAVIDEGMGMTGKVRRNLFSDVTNKSTKGTAGEKGTGLGLVLCKELAEMHGGSIAVESQEGKGSTFRLRIPHEPEMESMV